MNIKNYLKENFITVPEGKPLTEEEVEKYSAIIGNTGFPHEIDELVRFQEYYGINLPIVNKHLVIRVNVKTGEEEIYQSSTNTWE
jgi:hypothetical protein